MNRWIRRSLFGLAALGALAAGALGTGLLLAERKMNRHVDLAAVPRVALVLKTDEATLARGRYLYRSRGCADCHGAEGTGRTFVDEGALKLAGPNLTAGAGGVTAGYRPEDWERTLRHGVKPDGRPVMVMPSEDYARLTDADTAAIASYVQSLPPAPGGAAVISLPPPVRALYGFGLMQDAATKIDHRLPPALPVAEGVSVEHGRYVAQMCVGCHGPQLAGGRMPGAPPDWPAAADLRPGGAGLAPYAEAEALLRMFKSGRAPDGRALKVMPFEALGQMSDTDARALHLYLRSRTAVAALPKAGGG